MKNRCSFESDNSDKEEEEEDKDDEDIDAEEDGQKPTHAHSCHHTA